MRLHGGMGWEGRGRGVLRGVQYGMGSGRRVGFEAGG